VISDTTIVSTGSTPALVVAQAATPASANIVVTLPADASLFVDGNATTSTTGTRILSTPPLESGKTFTYTLTAKVLQDGKPVTLEEKVTVKAGETSQVHFQTPDNRLSSR